MTNDKRQTQGGNTNQETGSDLATTTSTVSAPEEVRNQVRDAARYRWLRVNNIVTNVRFHFASGESPYLYAEALDEAIDHNMGYDPLEALRTTSGKGAAS